MRIPIFILLAVGFFACGDDPMNDGNGGQPEVSKPDTGEDTQPAASDGTRVKVQHVLVGFQKAPGFVGRPVPSRALKRHKPAAEKLANEVFSRAKGGFDFTSLVRTYSDDMVQPGSTDPGIYVLVDGRAAGPGEFARKDMATAFGDVAFSLKVGEIGMALFDAVDSPFGWHIITRIE